MPPGVLLFVAVFCFSWGTLGTAKQFNIPQNPIAFTSHLISLGRLPGPLGYFNSHYMAFTQEEADEFPNLLSLHSWLRQIKNGGNSSGYPEQNGSETNETSQDESGSQNAPPIKRNNERGNRFKRDPSYPITTITGACETTIGGVNRLCTVCPAVTDLGPDKTPRYINELLCEGYELCGAGTLFGLCQNTVLNQDFLEDVNNVLQVYSQPIRVCCECSLFP